MKELLSVPAIRSLLAAQLVSVAGDRLFAIALVWWVVSQEHLPNRELMLGLLLAVSTLPIVVAGLVLGRIIDFVNKRSCMAVADFGRLLLVSVLAYIIHSDALTVPILFAVCIPIFALAPLFELAAEASLSPLSTSPRMLARLVALESAIPNLAAASGALCGSWALSQWSVEGAVWFNAATFLISLALVAKLPPLRARVEQPSAQQMGSGYFFRKRYPDAIRLMMLFGIINFFVAPLFVYLPLLARNVLQGDGGDLSLLELAFAMGNLLMFAYFSIRPRAFYRTRWLRFILVASSALFLCLLATAENLWQMFAVLMMWGASVAFVTYLAVSSFQRSIPDQFKGRFFAMLTSVCSMAVPASFALFGLLTWRFPLKEVIYSNAVLAFFGSLGFLTIPDDHENLPGAESGNG